MSIHVKIIRLFIIVCSITFLLLFFLNWIHEVGDLLLPSALSFGLLNTLIGGILTSSFVVLISEIVTYKSIKRATILNILQEYQSEYFNYSTLSMYIEIITDKENIYPGPIISYSKKIFESADRMRDIDYSQLIRNKYFKSYKKSAVNIGASASVLMKTVHSMNKNMNLMDSVISETLEVRLTPIEPIRKTLQTIKNHSDETCILIDELLLSLDDHTINYHWKERKELFEQIPLDIQF